MAIDSTMIWNEPNNMSHWDFQVDPDWTQFSRMAQLAAQAIQAENKSLKRVLGGISPIDANYMRRMKDQGTLDAVDVAAIHGFPLDWNHWQLNEWPGRVAEIREVIGDKELWVSEVGVSTFGAEEVQEFGLRRTAELLVGPNAPKLGRVHWYSLFDLPKAWPATTRHREAEGSSYYRHFYMGLIKEDGSPKKALRHFHEFAPALGICQWFHFEDPRLESGVKWLRELGVKKLRTGLSWADSYRPNCDAWFDKQMSLLEDFDVTVTFCFTPEHRGVKPHHTSPPQDPREFADFCARMVRRYAR